MNLMLDDINRMSDECNDILRAQENQLKELIARASQLQPHEGSLYGMLMTIMNSIEKIDNKISMTHIEKTLINLNNRMECIEKTLINLDNKLKCIDIVEIDV